MKQKESSELTDQEIIAQEKKENPIPQ